MGDVGSSVHQFLSECLWGKGLGMWVGKESRIVGCVFLS